VAREATASAHAYNPERAGPRAAVDLGFQPSGDGPGLGGRLLFTLGALLIYRVGSYIPVPGIDPQIFQEFFSRNAARGIFGMLDLFSGGALGRMTIFALTVTPYLSASIILQFLMLVSPKLQALKNAGEAGRRRLNQYARIGALILAGIQAYGIAIGIEGVGGGRSAVLDPGLLFRLSTVVTLTAGTAFLIWLSEQITARGVGNGLALIIFAGIVVRLPNSLYQLFEEVRVGVTSPFAAVLSLNGVVALIGFIVFMESARRRVLVQYPKRQIGKGMFGGDTSRLSLKLNTAGIIPPLFAFSLVALPAYVVLAVNPPGGWLAPLISALSRGHPLHLLLYVGLILFFCFFYTAIVYAPAEMADNLSKYGGLIPGIRPGKNTADYLDYMLTRLTLVGALYVAGVCLLPEILAYRFGLRFYLGGTSVLILVCVTMDFFGELGARLQGAQGPGGR
jgi:preprotein translocase subunit SecY